MYFKWLHATHSKVKNQGLKASWVKTLLSTLFILYIYNWCNCRISWHIKHFQLSLVLFHDDTDQQGKNSCLQHLI